MTTPRGGVLILDEEEMHATSLFLKSHMTLVIPKGCTLFGNTDKGAYPFIPGEVEVKDALPYEINTFEGDPKVGMPSLLSAYFAKDLNVVGEGTIDAQAQKSEFWIDVKKLDDMVEAMELIVAGKLEGTAVENHAGKGIEYSHKDWKVICPDKKV